MSSAQSAKPQQLSATAHILRTISRKVEVPLATLGYRDFAADPDWYRNLVSTTSVLWHPTRQTVVCGLTAFDTDLLYEFDPSTASFRSLGYPEVSEKFEIKIHRSLQLQSDGSVVGATAGLHREDQRAQAPGGRIFRYDFGSASYDHLGAPAAPDYVQSITVDERRGLAYGFTYPVFNFFVFDIERRQTRRIDYMGTIPHTTAVDRNGCVWGTWSNRTHSLFRYNPDTDELTYFDHCLPGSGSRDGVMFPGQGPIDMIIAASDGALYVGQLNGGLARVDPDSGEVEDLGRPIPNAVRLAALQEGNDGRIYGVNGFLGDCHLFSYDLKSGSICDHGQIADQTTGESLFIGHDMTIADDGTIYLGETDTADRAGYLWEVRLPDESGAGPSRRPAKEQSDRGAR